jgi:protein-tyrosine-phosphatase
LFLCFGNTCRSPAAEYLAKGMAEKKYKGELEDVEFDSSGFINAFSYAQPETVNYLKSKGVGMSDFRPKILNASHLKDNDLILTMEEAHKRKIYKKFKHIRDIDKKVYTLKEFTGNNDDIDIFDPYMKNYKAYLDTMIEIEKNVDLAIQKIIKTNTAE